MNLRISITVAIGIIVIMSSSAGAWPSAGQSNNRFALSYSRAVLATLPDSALVLQANWDIQSPFIYLRSIRGERTDVVMLDVNLLQRSWYVKQERRAHPDVFAGLDGEINAFLKAVSSFESGKTFDSHRIENAYLGLVNGLISRNQEERAVYVRDVQSCGHPGIAAAFPKTPGGYFLRVGKSVNNEPPLNPDGFLESSRRFTEREQYLLSEAAVSVGLQGRYAMSVGDTSRVVQTLSLARRLAPADPFVRQFETAVAQFLAQTKTEQP